MKLSKKTLYIGLFSLLYGIVAFSSYFHAISFFSLANNVWMSNILAFAFEVGQAAVLFSLLTSSKDRSRIMPWVLMGMFTLVQVIGNVFSSYKYLMTNSVEDLRYFKEPIFIWTNLPDDQATVIVVYLVGAILPIASLLLTSMVTNYLEDTKEENKENIQLELTEEEMINKLKESNPDLRIELVDGPPEGEGRSDVQEIDDLNILVNQKDKEIEELRKQLNEKEKEQMDDEENSGEGGTDGVQLPDTSEEANDTTEDKDDDTKEQEHTEIIGEIQSVPEEDHQPTERQKSHFINL